MASGRFENIAENNLSPVIRGSQEYMCKCPFCDGAASLQFNVDNGLWVCFKCDAKGNSKTLVQRLGGTYTDPVLSVDHIREHIDRIRMRVKHSDQKFEPVDESTLRRFAFPDDYWTEDRGFSEETIAAWDLGYDPIQDRHTIAYRNEHGELLGVIQRLKGDVFPRYIYPKGFNRKESLFGSWKVDQRKIALVEGSTDVLGMYESGIQSVAQYGSAISALQVRLLHRLGVQEVVLFYDYDEAGRKAEERSREMLDGIIMRVPVWDSDKYCWHKKLCGCGDHDWRTIAKCQKKRLCQCGRKHEMDPGALPPKRRKRMYHNAVLVGSKTTWTRR